MLTTNQKLNNLATQASKFDFYDVLMGLNTEERMLEIEKINEKLGYKLLNIHEMLRYEMKLKNTNTQHETLAQKINKTKEEEEAEYASKIARDMQKGYMMLLSAQ